MRGNGSSRTRGLAGAAIRFQPDSRLVRLTQEGHDAAFEEVVRRYRGQLVAFAGAIVPRDRAEDVVQESLTKAHATLRRGDSEINLRPWLYTIVRNRALNSLRDEPTHEHLDENFDGVPQPPDVAARREELAAVIAGLQGLPAAQREALVGRELEGRSHEDIAASLGTTPGAVRGLIYRARTALRDGLGLLIPVPVLRALMGSAPMGSDAANAGGAAAAGLAAGGGGVALKAGATLGVAVIAVGSGLAIQHRGAKPDASHAVTGPRSEKSAGASGPRSGRAELLAESGSRGPGGGHGDNSGPSSSSGPGPGPGGGSSGEGPGGGGHSGPGGSGDGGGHGGSSGSGSSGSGSSGSGDDGGHSGSSGSGSDDGGSSGSSGSGSSGSGDDGGHSGSSGSGSSGSGSGSGEIVDGDDGGGDDSSGHGGGGETTTTTTTSDSGGEGSG